MKTRPEAYRVLHLFSVPFSFPSSSSAFVFCLHLERKPIRCRNFLYKHQTIFTHPRPYINPHNHLSLHLHNSYHPLYSITRFFSSFYHSILSSVPFTFALLRSFPLWLLHLILFHILVLLFPYSSRSPSRSSLHLSPRYVYYPHGCSHHLHSSLLPPPSPGTLLPSTLPPSR